MQHQTIQCSKHDTQWLILSFFVKYFLLLTDCDTGMILYFHVNQTGVWCLVTQFCSTITTFIGLNCFPQCLMNWTHSEYNWILWSGLCSPPSLTQLNYFFIIMDLVTLVPRTLVGVVYPAFMSLKAVLHGSPESAGAWLRYWVVLGVFSLVELILDPFINPIRWALQATDSQLWWQILHCICLQNIYLIFVFVSATPSPHTWCWSVSSWFGACFQFSGMELISSSTKWVISNRHSVACLAFLLRSGKITWINASILHSFNSASLAIVSNFVCFQVLFPLFKEHHKEIEDQAEKAKQSFKDKFGDFFKSDKKENGKENGKKNGVVVKTKDKPEKEEKKQN